MLKYLFLILMVPFLSFGQSEPMETHAAVFFHSNIDKQQQLNVLRRHGQIDPSKIVQFNSRPVVFIPMPLLNEAGLLSENEVECISPVFTNDKHDFITYGTQFLVKLKNQQDLHVLEKEAVNINVEVVGPNRFLPEIIRLKTTKSGMNAADAVDYLKATNLFQIVSLNLMHSVKDCSVDDPRFYRQWNLKNEGTSMQGNGTPGADIDAELAWDITTGNSDIKIAIMDSGIDTLHPDLEGKLLPGFDAFGEGTKGYPTPNFSSDGHGTACAGIAAATTNNDLGIAGVCQGCKVIPVRIFNYVELGAGNIVPWSETEVFVNGISWSWQEADADVSSNSWGVPDDFLALFPGGDSIVNIAIDAALENGREGLGLPMIFSSGNDGLTDSIPIWPARYEKTIAVGATSMCDEHKTDTSCDGEEWWAGNWGEGVDVSAPGVRIATIDMLGTNGFHTTEYYNVFNGTSAACPNVAGTVGLMLSEHPNLSANQVRETLGKSCEKVGGYDYSTLKQFGGWSLNLGYGRINAHQALLYAGVIGVEEVSENQISVQTQTNLHKIILDNKETVQWELLDMNGRIVMIGNDRKEITIQHQQLSTGIYALKIMSDKMSESIKLLVP